MKEAKRLKQDLVEDIIAQIPNDTLAEISDRADRSILSNRLHCGHRNQQDKKHASIGCRDVQMNVEPWNGYGRRGRSAQQGVEDQANQEWRDCFEHTNNSHETQRNEENEAIRPNVGP